MELLRVENICVAFDKIPVLKDISFSMNKGELVSILGLSGSGKSTLLNVISGLLKPDSGSVFLNEKEITGRPGQVSYMLQKDLLLAYKKIIDNVSLPLVIRGMKKAEARRAAEPYFKQFGLEGTQQKYPSQLSGGMRQRAALLRTYLCSKGLILLDEPFSALDPITKAMMHKWYLSVAADMGFTTLLITHDVDEAIRLSDRICLLSGSPGEIRHTIDITVPRNSREGFDLSPDFLSYKQQIISRLGANYRLR